MGIRPLAMLLICAFFGLLLSPAVTAAEAGGVAMDRLVERLQLTADQQQVIQPALERRNEQLRALRDKAGSGSRRQRLGMLREARAIQKEFDDKVQPVLTPAQQTEWKVLREEMKDAVRERRAARD